MIFKKSLSCATICGEHRQVFQVSNFKLTHLAYPNRFAEDADYAAACGSISCSSAAASWLSSVIKNRSHGKKSVPVISYFRESLIPDLLLFADSHEAWVTSNRRAMHDHSRSRQSRDLSG